VFEVIWQEFLAFPFAHAVDVRAVLEDAIRIHGGEGAADDDWGGRGDALQPAGHAFGGRVGGGREKRESDHIGPIV